MEKEFKRYYIHVEVIHTFDGENRVLLNYFMQVNDAKEDLEYYGNLLIDKIKYWLGYDFFRSTICFDVDGGPGLIAPKDYISFKIHKTTEYYVNKHKNPYNYIYYDLIGINKNEKNKDEIMKKYKILSVWKCLDRCSIVWKDTKKQALDFFQAEINQKCYDCYKNNCNEVYLIYYNKPKEGKLIRKHLLKDYQLPQSDENIWKKKAF